MITNSFLEVIFSGGLCDSYVFLLKTCSCMFGFECFVQQDAANNHDITLSYCICRPPPSSALHCCHKYGQKKDRGSFHITNTSCRYNIYEHHDIYVVHEP